MNVSSGQMTIDQAVSLIKAQSGTPLTEEQEEVVKNFDRSMAIFANPGTGKTTTAVAGLIAAQTYFGIPGRSINAMSFTKLATAELSSRYSRACKKCNIAATVQFNTFHSICYRIVREAYPNFQIKRADMFENDLRNFAEFLKDEGCDSYQDMYFVKEVFKAVNSLNSELLFSKGAVSASAKFINISDRITLKQFQMVRRRWFLRAFISKMMDQGDIPMMVLYILHANPELQEKYRKEFRLMVVDEFQDMSILYLEVLSLIAENLIVIGDLKQQIFGFNGSSPLILDAYKNLYKDAVYLELTQSFRCASSIVENANNVIAPNEIPGWENFKGVDEEGAVYVDRLDGMDFDKVVEACKEKQDRKEYIDLMFLARNNASVVPIIEKLYRKGVIFRTTKFLRLMDIPMWRDVCNLAEWAINTRDTSCVHSLTKIFPEFSGVSESNNPILKVMRSSPNVLDHDLLTMKYIFRDERSYAIIKLLRDFVEAEEAGQPFITSSEYLIQIYEEYIIRGKWWRLEHTREYYENLVNCIIRDQTYKEIRFSENDKLAKNEHYCKLGEGVRCYTFHASKGLEAHEVYLMDVDEGVLPKSKTLEDLINKGCTIEAAREVRNERNLLYVAVTRAKRILHVCYSEELSALIATPAKNQFTFLDKIWKDNAVLANESASFKLLMGVGG